jgi:hypothetical protein
MRLKKYLGLLAAVVSLGVAAQGATVIRGEITPGSYNQFKTDSAGNIYTLPGTPSGGTAATSSSQVSFVSTNNSSTSNLGANGVFTGTSEDCSNFAEMRVSVFVDQASATDGLQIQQSNNGTNWDNSDTYTVPASTGKAFGSGIGARFCRIVYTNNNTTPTTALRIQTIYHSVRTKPSAIRPQDGRSNDNDFEETASYMQVFNGTTWDRAKGDAAAGQYVQLRAATTGGYSFARMSTATTTTIKSGAGTLHSIILGTVGVGSTLVCYDNTAASGTVIISAATTAEKGGMLFDLAFTVGLTCITTGGTPADITFTYK